MAKKDLKRELRAFYSAPEGEPETVDVPPMDFVMVDGKGDPNDNQEFVEAMEALYGLAYTLKFMLKRGPEPMDYTVMPLQGLWWADDMEVFAMDHRGEWSWTLMIMHPPEVTEEHFEAAREELRRKKGPAAVDKLRFERYHEGPSAQIMHLGPYSEEAPTIAKLHEFIKDGGHQFRGKHHEIYLGDPRRSAPEKLRTIIRQPYE
jgi:hypothetical protein